MHCWVLVWLVPALLADSCHGGRGAGTPPHSNNWAVIVSTSMYWYNYRHTANALSIYRSAKRLGIPDSQIILMVAEDHACDARNAVPATVFNDRDLKIDVYGEAVEVDYRGSEVTPESFFRLLQGRHTEGTPPSKRLPTDAQSNILVYMTGHGGEHFLKFRDAALISSSELADTFAQMWEKRRYRSLLFIMETCHAESMLLPLHSPNIIGMASARTHEDSFSVSTSTRLGVAMTDEFTANLLAVLEDIGRTSTRSVLDVFTATLRRTRSSVPVLRKDLFPGDLASVPILHFFGNARQFVLLPPSAPPASAAAASSVASPKEEVVRRGEAMLHMRASFSLPGAPSEPPSAHSGTLLFGALGWLSVLLVAAHLAWGKAAPLA
jgi:phosphatidylinositol glycan class K